MTSEVQIERCKTEDFPSVCALLSQLWPDKILAIEKIKVVFEDSLLSKTKIFLVAKVENKVIGFGSLSLSSNLWQAGNLARIDELVIDSEFRGRSNGRMLLEALLQEARAHACTCVELDSGFQRRDAHAFYEKLGFERRAFVFWRNS